MSPLADANERGQRRQPLRLQFAGRGAVDLRRQLAQHGDIVAGLERLGGDQRLAADLVERVFELGQAIGRIDVDEDQAGLGGRELGDHPFGIVRRPDADAVAGRKPERQQPGGQGVDLGFQLAIAPADVLLPHDQRVALAPALRRLVEMHADGVADQRHVGGAVDVALGQFRHTFLLSDIGGRCAECPSGPARGSRASTRRLLFGGSFRQRVPICHLV